MRFSAAAACASETATGGVSPARCCIPASSFCTSPVSEIAHELVVSQATAKTHVRNVLAKLSLRDRVHAVVFAYESGLVQAGAD